MRTFIKYPKRILASTPALNQLYHFDDRVFNLGDTISGNDYSTYMDEAVIAAYSKTNPSISNIATMLYCTTNPTDYSGDYAYRYTVELYESNRRLLECSPVTCLDIWKSIVRRNSSLNDPTIRQYFIELMADAYVENKPSIDTLIREFGFDPGNAVEYIADSGVVVDVKQF